MLGNLLDQLEVDKPRGLLDQLEEAPKRRVHYPTFYNEDAWEESLKTFLKDGYGALGTSPSKDKRFIRATRSKNLVDGNISALGMMRGVYGGAKEITRGFFHPLNDPNFYRHVVKSKNPFTFRSLYADKPPSWLPGHTEEIARYQMGKAGPTHLLGSAMSTAKNIVTGGIPLVYNTIGTLYDYLDEGVDLALTRAGVIPEDDQQGLFRNLEFRQKFETWAGNMLHYQFIQRPLAKQISDLMYGDEKTVSRVLEELRIEPSGKASAGEIIKGAALSAAKHTMRPISPIISEILPSSGRGGYTEQDVAKAVKMLQQKYKEIALDKKKSAEMRQYSDAFFGDYTDANRFIEKARKEPVEVIADIADLAFIGPDIIRSARAGKLRKLIDAPGNVKENIDNWKAKRAELDPVDELTAGRAPSPEEVARAETEYMTLRSPEEFFEEYGVESVQDFVNAMRDEIRAEDMNTEVLNDLITDLQINAGQLRFTQDARLWVDTELIPALRNLSAELTNTEAVGALSLATDSADELSLAASAGAGVEMLDDRVLNDLAMMTNEELRTANSAWTREELRAERSRRSQNLANFVSDQDEQLRPEVPEPTGDDLMGMGQFDQQMQQVGQRSRQEIESEILPVEREIEAMLSNQPSPERDTRLEALHDSLGDLEQERAGSQVDMNALRETINRANRGLTHPIMTIEATSHLARYIEGRGGIAADGAVFVIEELAQDLGRPVEANEIRRMLTHAEESRERMRAYNAGEISEDEFNAGFQAYREMLNEFERAQGREPIYDAQGERRVERTNQVDQRTPDEDLALADEVRQRTDALQARSTDSFFDDLVEPADATNQGQRLEQLDLQLSSATDTADRLRQRLIDEPDNQGLRVQSQRAQARVDQIENEIEQLVRSESRADVLQGDAERSRSGFDTRQGATAAQRGRQQANVFDDTQQYPTPDSIMEQMDTIYDELESLTPNDTARKMELERQLAQATEAMRRRLPQSARNILDDEMGFIDPSMLGIPQTIDFFRNVFRQIKENFEYNPEDLEKVLREHRTRWDAEAETAAAAAGERARREGEQVREIAEQVGQQVEQRVARSDRPSYEQGRISRFMREGSATPRRQARRMVSRHFAETGSLRETARRTWQTYQDARTELKQKREEMGLGKKPAVVGRKHIHNLDAAIGETTTKLIREAFEDAGLTADPENVAMAYQRVREAADGGFDILGIVNLYKEAKLETATNIEVKNFLNQKLRQKDSNLPTKMGEREIDVTQMLGAISYFKEDVLIRRPGQTASRYEGPQQSAINAIEKAIDEFLESSQRGGRRDIEYLRDRELEVFNDEKVQNHELFRAINEFRINTRRNQPLPPIRPQDLTFMVVSDPTLMDSPKIRIGVKLGVNLEDVPNAIVTDFLQTIKATDGYKKLHAVDSAAFRRANLDDVFKLWSSAFEQFDKFSAVSDRVIHGHFRTFMEAVQGDLRTYGTKRKYEPIRRFMKGIDEIQKNISDSHNRRVVEAVAELKDDKIGELFFSRMSTRNISEFMNFMFEDARKPGTARLTTPEGRADPGKWTRQDRKKALVSTDPAQWTPEQKQMLLRGHLVNEIIKEARSGIGDKPDQSNRMQTEGAEFVNIHKFQRTIKRIGNERGVAIFGEDVWRDLNKMTLSSHMHQLIARMRGEGGGLKGALTPLEMTMRQLRRVVEGKEWRRRLKTTKGPGQFPLQQLIKQFMLYHPAFKLTARGYERARRKPEDLQPIMPRADTAEYLNAR